MPPLNRKFECLIEHLSAAVDRCGCGTGFLPLRDVSVHGLSRDLQGAPRVSGHPTWAQPNERRIAVRI